MKAHEVILASPPLAARATGAFIDRAERLDEPGASDHAPVVVVLAD
jgi:exonuclease III